MTAPADGVTVPDGQGQDDRRPGVFFGYSSSAPVRNDTLERAYMELQEEGIIQAVPWTTLHIGGRYIIDAITDAIRDADLSAFDVTDLNPNVIFELGYAIGSDRKVWLLRDHSDEAGRRDWERFRVLTTLGYTAYVNSGEIVRGFHTQQPLLAQDTVFRQSIANQVATSNDVYVFYVRSLYETDADRLIYRRLQAERRRAIEVRIADPMEAAVQSLSWYAQQIYASEGVVVHLSSPARHDAAIHNVRCAFLAGLAVGIGKPTLMLSEYDYASPIDYRDLLARYTSALGAVQDVDSWIAKHLAQTQIRLQEDRHDARHTANAVDLRSFRLGDPVAENEKDALPDYFVDTAAYDDLIKRRKALFIGRKGTGKTANLLVAASELQADRRNLVVVINPYSYDLISIEQLVRQYLLIGEGGYLLESLWKFLIYTEIAGSAYALLTARAAPPAPNDAEGRFMQFMRDHEDLLMSEFAVRLEGAVNRLSGAEPASADVGAVRRSISEALHDGVLRQIREHLGHVLSGKQRVAVLIDNLDKAWSARADLAPLSQFLLALLNAVEGIETDFRRKDYWREPVAFTLAIFLRTDIYEHVREAASEPDKLPLTRLEWSDPDLLLRVVEERYAVYRGHTVDGSEVWMRFFRATTAGLPTRDYILRRVMPRPRDILYYCTAAISSAVNHRRSVVDRDDLSAADNQYSQFAFEALVVENAVSMANLGDIMYEFYGGAARWDARQLLEALRLAGIQDTAVPGTIQYLAELSFLGVQLGDGRVEYSYDLEVNSRPLKRLSSILSTRPSSLVTWVHPAFRPYLDIPDVDQ